MHPQKSDEGRINCVPHGAIYALGIGSDLAVGQIRRRPSRVGAPHGANYDAYANSDSPSESSLANSGAIRSDGRKNPSAYYALASLTGKRPRPPYGGRADLKLEDFPPADIRGGKIRLCFGQKVR